MLPEITEIVLVKKALSLAEEKVGERDLCRVGREPCAASPANAIFLTTDEEAVEIEITPMESDLDGVVKVSDAERTDVAQQDVELIELKGLFSLGHGVPSVSATKLVGEHPLFSLVSYLSCRNADEEAIKR